MDTDWKGGARGRRQTLDNSKPLLAATVLAMLLAACPGTRPPGTIAPGATPGEQPRVGGLLRVGLAGDVDSLDPARATNPASWFFARALHRGLLTFSGAAAVPVPDLARALPDISSDGLRYTFHLRGDGRFGPPASRGVRASDAVASIRRTIRAGVGVARYFRAPDANAVALAAVQAPGDQTVVITLSKPAPDLPWILAHPQFSIIPAETPFAPADPRAIAPAGPYVLRSYQPESSIQLARNPAWTAKADPVRGAYVDRIAATIGDTSGLPVDLGPIDRGGASLPQGCVRYLFMNQRVPPFDRALVRRAVAHAVQRAPLQGATRARLHGAVRGPRFLPPGVVRAPGLLPPGVVRAPRLLPPGVVGHSDSELLPEDLGAARAALIRAKLPHGFETVLVTSSAPRDRTEASLIVRSLARTQIRVRVIHVNPSELYAARYEVQSARVPMGVATWCADWPGLAGRSILGVIADPRGARPNDNPVYSNLVSSDLRRALDRAREMSPDRAVRAWMRADAVAVSTASIVPLLWAAPPAAQPGFRGGGALPGVLGYDPATIWLAQ